MDDNNAKYLVFGIGGILVAGAIYLLSSDGKERVKLDPKVYTKEKLLEIMDDLTLEYSCSYLLMNSIVCNLKEDEPESLTEEMKNGVRFKLKEMTNRKDEEVSKRHGIDVDTLALWMKKFENDPEVKAFTARIASVEAHLLDNSQEQVDFGLPKGLNKESYIIILRKIFATVRYRYFLKVKNWREERKGQAIDENQSAKFLTEIDPEEFRKNVLELYEVKVPQGETAKRVMQRCYIKYCTGFDGKRWNKEIDYEQKIHAEILEKIRKEIKIEKIEIDPLTTKEQSYVVDYSGMPGYQKMDSINESKFHVQPKESTQNYVAKMVEKGRQARDEVIAQKMLHEAEEKKQKKEAKNQANSDPILEDHEGEAQEENEAEIAQPEDAKQVEPEQAATIKKVEPASDAAQVKPKEEPKDEEHKAEKPVAEKKDEEVH